MFARWFSLLVVAGACSSALGPLDRAQFDVVAELGEPFTLKVGELALVTEADINVRFFEVAGDSRCPSHALILCVWEGDGAILVESAGSNFAGRIDMLHTTLDPKAVDLGIVVLELLSLDPYPETTDPIPVGDYSARFIARRGN